MSSVTTNVSSCSGVLNDKTGRYVTPLAESTILQKDSLLKLKTFTNYSVSPIKYERSHQPKSNIKGQMSRLKRLYDKGPVSIKLPVLNLSRLNCSVPVGEEGYDPEYISLAVCQPIPKEIDNNDQTVQTATVNVRSIEIVDDMPDDNTHNNSTVHSDIDVHQHLSAGGYENTSTNNDEDCIKRDETLKVAVEVNPVMQTTNGQVTSPKKRKCSLRLKKYHIIKSIESLKSSQLHNLKGSSNSTYMLKIEPNKKKFIRGKLKDTLVSVLYGKGSVLSVNGTSTITIKSKSILKILRSTTMCIANNSLKDLVLLIDEMASCT
ncbi:hypothetical protein GJ496_001266 [Pomphorhynchus laevis]|nr:hypothetical protein GJ496_001266 [Pomphorhynchus laevis]